MVEKASNNFKPIKTQKEREGVAGDGERMFRVNSKGGPGKQ